MKAKCKIYYGPFIRRYKGGSPTVISLVAKSEYPKLDNLKNRIIKTYGNTLSLTMKKDTKEICCITIIKGA